MTARLRPPKSVWACVRPTARHGGEERPDLWATLLDVLDDLYGEAAARLEAALRDPLSSEGLIGAIETWEAMEGGLTAARESVGLKRGAVAARLRETREGPLNGFATGDVVDRTIVLACEVEGRIGIEGANELKDAVMGLGTNH